MPTRQLGGYLELPVPPHMAHAAECLWVHAIGQGGTDARCGAHRVLPDTCVSLALMCRRDADGRVLDGGLALIGPIQRPRPLLIQPGHEIAAVRLYPEWLPALLPAHAGEHLDAVDGIATLLRGRDRLLCALLEGTRHWREACRVLAEWTAAALAAAPSGDARGRLAAEALRRAPPQRPVRSAADALGISPRQLQRRLRDAAGLGPKAFSRTLRFNRVLAMADAAAEPDWATLSAAGGYADQSHLVHEFRELTGLSPAGMLGERRLESALYSPLP